MKIFPQLFKRTTNGDIQVWHLEQEMNQFRSVTGKRGGKMTTSAWTTCKAKNVGKSNEINPVEQALAEIDAKYTKKLRQDFYDDVSKIDNQMRHKPMLAIAFDKVVDKLEDDEILYFQPKLDGYRCVADKNGLWTRDGLKIPTCPHVQRALERLFIANPSLIFDGELYNHDLHDDFNTIGSILKRKTPSIADFLRSEELAQYHIYDMPSHGGTFSQRNTELNTLITGSTITGTGDSTPLRLVETVSGKAEDAVDFLNHFMEQGYEGAIARRDAKYEFKRSKSLIKVKKFLDEEFQLVGLEDGKGSRAGIAARAILQLKDGRSFKAGIIGSHEYCKELLDNFENLRGQMATVQFLNYTPAGIPRGGKLKTMRWA